MGQTPAQTGTPPHLPITVEQIKHIRHSRVVAIADINTGCGFIIRGFQVISDGPGKRRVIGPMSQSIGRDGAKHYQPLCGFHPATKAVCEQLILQAYADMLGYAEVLND
jgi:hypothetical protein